MFIELTAPTGKLVYVLASAIECIYEQNSLHLNMPLTEIVLTNRAQCVKELPQYIINEILKTFHPEHRNMSPRFVYLAAAAEVHVLGSTTKRTPPPRRKP